MLYLCKVWVYSKNNNKSLSLTFSFNQQSNSSMATPKPTDLDPNLSDPNPDKFGDIDPFTTLGYLSTDLFPGEELIISDGDV